MSQIDVQYLRSVYGQNWTDAQWDAAFRMAWEEGHAYGWEEVENHLADLAYLVNMVREEEARRNAD